MTDQPKDKKEPGVPPSHESGETGSGPSSASQAMEGTQVSASSTGLGAFWQELRRRHVVRVGIVYLITGWVIIQIASATFENFGIPVWAFRFVSLMVVLGFPVALILAWAFG